jgi:hypothetical protein
VDKYQRQKMDRWADRGIHAGPTALTDRLSSTLSAAVIPVISEPQAKPFRGLLVAVGAAAFTIFVIVSSVLVVRFGASDPLLPAGGTPNVVDVITTIPAPFPVEPESTQPTTVVVMPVPSNDIDLSVWVPVPVEMDVFGFETVYDAQWVDGTLYAVGFSNDVEGDVSSFRGTVWRSTDGIGWQRVATVPDEGSVMLSVAGGNGMLVAVGEIMWSPDDAAIWTSVDGVDWVRVVDDGEIFDSGLGHIDEVTAGGPGFVAVGSVCENVPDTGDPCVGQPTAWVSDTGEDWERVVLAGVAGEANDITVHDGTLVAVGTITSESGDAAAVWTSSDGYTWEWIVDDEAFDTAGNQWLTSVASSGDGLVAVGGSAEPDHETTAVIWFSADGSSWSIRESYAIEGAAWPVFEGVATVGTQFVVIGTRVLVVGPQNEDQIGEIGMVWTSPDGETWTKVDTGGLFSTARLSIVAGDPSGALVFANDGGLDRWRSPAE